MKNAKCLFPDGRSTAGIVEKMLDGQYKRKGVE